jgi:putative selenium metabolism protein SsnA
MLLIGNGNLVTRDPANPFLPDGCVAAEGPRIVEVGPTEALRDRHPGAEFLDARGGLIHPGFINAHMHFYSAFSRGFGGKGDTPPAKSFTEVLERLWWRLDKALTPEDVRYSALVGLVEAIRRGCTTLIDHHASPHAVPGSLFEIAEAARRAGLACCLSYEVSDRDGEEIRDQGIRENRDFFRHAGAAGDPLLAATFGLHASMTLSDRTLALCAEAGAAEAGVHVHVAEGPEDEPDSERKYGMRILERFRRFGLLGRRSLAIHCIHVNEAEREILAETGTAVVHNPESNMGNAVGAAPIREMLDRGIPVGLGTDGYVSDMLRAYAMANALRKHASGDPNAAWEEIPRMLFENNRLIADRYFSLPRGRLAPGCAADLAVLDYRPPTDLSDRNVNGHLLFGPGAGCVAATVCAGRVLMRDRELVGLDEAEIAAKARECARRVWARF